METSSQRVKQVRKELKMTQKEFSESLGYNQAYCSEIERGIKTPTSKMVERLFAQFKVSSDWIINGIGDIFITNNSGNNSGLDKANNSGFSSENKSISISIKEIEAILSIKSKSNKAVYDSLYNIAINTQFLDIRLKLILSKMELIMYSKSDSNDLKLNKLCDFLDVYKHSSVDFDKSSDRIGDLLDELALIEKNNNNHKTLD